MKLSRWLTTNVNKLKEAGVATARLDCLVLLEDVTGKDRSWLLAHTETELTKPELSKLGKWTERRSNHEPLAYIRGKTEFYGREFLLNPHTLEPRPETETMIEVLKRADIKPDSVIVDVGTGSGCIAITAKLEMPGLDVLATDIDKKCIQTAAGNARELGADITFYEGSLLEPISSLKVSAILCNLPYVPDKYELNAAAKFEPRRAIFGGEDGLNLYRQLFSQVRKLPEKPEHILTESLPFQHRRLSEIAAEHGYELVDTDDFIQQFRRTRSSK